MKNLVSDLIVYATAAQKYTGYNTNDLIADRFAGNENFTPTSGDVPACSDFSLSASADAGVYFASASVNFSNVNRLYFTYVTDDAANTVVKVDGKAITEVIDLGGGKYGVYSADLYATEFDRILTVTVEKSGNLVQTLTYSINHYAAQKQSSANTAMAELAKATYRYGASAEKYAKGGSV